MNIRQARQIDIPAICSFDHLVDIEDRRRGFIEDSVRSGRAWVAVVDEQPVGYVVLEYNFFGRGFIAMLYVHPDHRRNGHGSALIQQAEGLCKTPGLGYSPSGVIQNLDPGDPELIYFKKFAENVKWLIEKVQKTQTLEPK